jgi:hypothetical protein
MQPRPPSFSFPAIERTLPASYPTPLVGDVVYVVQKNPNEPGYAVPDYGTPHPDTKAYAGYELAFVRVSDDKQSAQWFYATNRANQDLYNYAVKYSGDSAAHKIYVRTYIVPREGYTRPDNGTPDSADPAALLVSEEDQGPLNDTPELSGLFNRVVRVFETIPGPLLSSADNMTAHRTLLPFISAVPKTITTQFVSAGTDADQTDPNDPDKFLIVEAKTEGDSVAKARKTTTKVSRFATLNDSQIAPEAHGALAATVKKIVPSSTTATGTITITGDVFAPAGITINDGHPDPFLTALPYHIPPAATPFGNYANSLAAAINNANLNVSASATVGMDHATITLTAKMPGAAGNAIAFTVHGAQLIASGPTLTGGGTAQPIPGGVNILQSAIEDVDGTHAIQSVTQLAEPWPELVEYTIDEQTKITVKILKSIVDASTVTDAQAGFHDGWYVEFKQLDKFKSAKIQSQIVGSLPSDIVYYSSRPLSLPDTLLSITPQWDDSNNGGSGAGNGAISSAHATATSYCDGDVLVLMQHGFRGYAKARITKRYLSAPPDQSAIPTPTIIKPSYGTAVVISKGQSSSAEASSNGNSSSSSFSGGSQIRTKAIHIGPVLTPAISTTNVHHGVHQHNEATSGTEGPAYLVESADADSLATLTVNIPASTPAAISSGTYILDEVVVEQWRLGVWVMMIVEVLVP